MWLYEMLWVDNNIFMKPNSGNKLSVLKWQMKKERKTHHKQGEGEKKRHKQEQILDLNIELLSPVTFYEYNNSNHYKDIRFPRWYMWCLMIMVFVVSELFFSLCTALAA